MIIRSRSTSPLRLARFATAGVAAAAVSLGTLGAAAQGRPDNLLVPAQFAPAPGAPASFADLVEKVKPSVVSISVQSGNNRTAQNQPAPGQKQQPTPRTPRVPDGLPDLPDDHPLNEFFKRFGQPPGPQGQGPTVPRQSQGSGFVISADGYVVTNNHVIDGATKIQVAFDENNKHEADLIGADSRTDVALLKIKNTDGKTFPFVKFADKASRVGDWVLAVGNPFGLGGTVTAGIVSALGRDIGSGPYDYLQIDAAVNRGNSGGPTFNMSGEVIGVNTAIYSPSGGNVGIAFAVPSKVAAEVIAQLRSTGSVDRGWLGVKIENVDEDKAAAIGLKNTKGAFINEVTAGGPAAASGLKEGDTILSVNGDAIADSRELARMIATFKPNTTVDVKVWRSQKEQNVPVKLGNFPGAKELAKAEDTPKAAATAGTAIGQLGLSLTATTGPKKEGVTISKVENDSDAATKGLRQGDIILDIGGAAVSSPEDVAKGVEAAEKAGRQAVLLRLKSGEQVRFVGIKIKKG